MADCIMSENDVRQGCALGALLFVLSVQPVFMEVVKRCPDILAVAIMYDFYIIGDPIKAIEAYKVFDELCLSDGSLHLKKDKGKLLYFHGKALSKRFPKEWSRWS